MTDSLALQRLTSALKEIAEVSTRPSICQPGASFALGVLADLAGATPDDDITGLARKILTPALEEAANDLRS